MLCGFVVAELWSSDSSMTHMASAVPAMYCFRAFLALRGQAEWSARQARAVTSLRREAWLGESCSRVVKPMCEAWGATKSCSHDCKQSSDVTSARTNSCASAGGLQSLDKYYSEFDNL